MQVVFKTSASFNRYLPRTSESFLEESISLELNAMTSTTPPLVRREKNFACKLCNTLNKCLM